MRLSHTATVTVQRTVEFAVPKWIEYAMKGQKINAIKELREYAARDGAQNMLSLGHAKRIVEGFVFNTSEFEV